MFREVWNVLLDEAMQVYGQPVLVTKSEQRSRSVNHALVAAVFARNPGTAFRSVPAHHEGRTPHSHSIVAGGFPEMS